jgi:hypothetical protein
MHYDPRHLRPALLPIFCWFLFATIPPLSHAGFLVGWDLSGLTGYGPSPLIPSTLTGDITVGGLTRGTGVTTSGTAAANGWGGTGWMAANLAVAISDQDFATFSITGNNAIAAPAIRFTAIDSYNIRRSATGPTTGQWQYQIGSGSFTNIGSQITWGTTTTATGNLQSAINLTAIAPLQNVSSGTTVTFRIVNWGATATGGTWYFNNFTSGNSNTPFDLVIRGEAIPEAIPEPTSLVLTGLAGVVGWYGHRRTKRKATQKTLA